MAFCNIVVAVDGSEASHEAVEHAVKMARHSEAALTGIFVLDTQWPDFIGNDWQSSKGARQGFLDHIRLEQEAQADAARAQFESAASDLERATFCLHAGDPTDVLIEQANSTETDLLIASRRVFQVSGRPSLKSLATQLTRKALRPILLLP
jgi:nucleotide-binding universal stress UspA family protein